MRVRALLSFLLFFALGCQMNAPVHTWSSAKVVRPGVVRVAIAPVGVASRAIPTTNHNGLEDLRQAARQLESALQDSQPHPSPLLIAIFPKQLEQAATIQLVSYDDQPSDNAIVGAARSTNADLLLQGNVVFANLKPPEEKQKRLVLASIFGKRQNENFIVVHWTVVDVVSGQRVLETTIQTTEDDVKKASGKTSVETTARVSSILSLASYRGWRLVTSEPRAKDVLLDLPWTWIGSTQVRKGNGYAKQGRWDLAEQEWQSVADAHPTNAAAWHNLAIAAAAREDFALARSRLKHADSIARGRTTYDTELWIEKQQRDYHAVMNLPPPPEGWKFPDSTIEQLREEW